MLEGKLEITFKKGKKNKKSKKPQSITVIKTLTFGGSQKSLDTVQEQEISLALTQKIEQAVAQNIPENFEVEFEYEQGNRIKKVKEKGTLWDREEEVLRVRETPNANPFGNTNQNKVNSDIDYQSDFYNPYNFIPTPPRDKTNTELDDRKPMGHGKYHQGYWSGNIAVTLKTKTPLLIPDASNATEDSNEHKTYDIRQDSQGKPILPITSVKGMLRSEYEAITNSRYGIWQKHEDRLAYRMSAKSDNILPARVEKNNDRLFLRVMDNNSLVGKTAKLKRYDKNSSLEDAGESRAATRYQSSKTLPKHGDAVWVKLDKSKVKQIIPYEQTPDDMSWKKGWVCVTGANIQDKMNERVFLENTSDELILVTPEIKSLWEELIKNYQQTHIKDLKTRQRQGKKPSDYLGHKSVDTAWSKHIWDKNELKFDEGTLCYVEFDDRGEIIAIQPVTISRRLYTFSPEKLLDKSLKPPTKMDELSPADRVFGWVKQKGNGSYKGNLRINSMSCDTKNSILSFGKDGFPLNILGKPQESQAKFYQAQDKEGTPLSNGIQKEEGYSNQNQGLRGRKVYPHQNLPDNHWDNPTQNRTHEDNNGHHQEYYRPDSEKDDQNRSIKAWVKQATIFTFNIDITNLSTVELGALLYLLSLEENHYHRLGGAKPYGFGSVSLTIDWDKSDLRMGEGWKEYYSSLLNETSHGNDKAKETIDTYQNAIKEAYSKNNQEFTEVSFIKAFEVYTRGYQDNLPTHYPRLQANPNNNKKIFDWFVENDANRNEGDGFKLALPELAIEKGLPLQPHQSKTAKLDKSQRR